MDTDMEDRIAYSKLQTVCEIRKGMSQLERVKQRLIGDLEVSDAERRSLSEYRREMDLLLQEKMSHVEELRQIHADINAIEDVMKQCDESRLRRLDSARRLHAEYRPLKLQMDRMRQQLGLQPLPDITELEPELPVNELLETGGDTRACSDDTVVVAGSQGGLTPSGPHPTPGMGFMSAGVPPTSLSVMRINNKPQLSMSAGGGTGQQQQQNVGRAGHSPTAFRQQPPPMKSCLSCHQQIHRNAPICPLCKAKSRSRNPKKPKKKEQ